LRILRYPSITEQQFSGCVTAFVDSLSGELNSATIALRRLEGRNKGSAFAYEMTLDTHRYGALIVLDRWGTLLRAFGPHLKLASKQSVIAEGPTRVTSAETILTQANHLLDAGDWYSPAVVEACTLAFQSLDGIFKEERAFATQTSSLGPMLSDDHKQARLIFLEDLAAR
jgi:hypothetical protein